METGDNNTAVGNDAARLDSGSNNTAIGGAALRYNQRSNNTAVGAYAAFFGNYNPAATGYEAFKNIENTAVGYRTLNSNASGSKNTALGFRALAMDVDNSIWYSNGLGVLSRNTAVGDSSQANGVANSNSCI